MKTSCFSLLVLAMTTGQAIAFPTPGEAFMPPMARAAGGKPPTPLPPTGVNPVKTGGMSAEKRGMLANFGMFAVPALLGVGASLWQGHKQTQEQKKEFAEQQKAQKDSVDAQNQANQVAAQQAQAQQAAAEAAAAQAAAQQAQAQAAMQQPAAPAPAAQPAAQAAPAAPAQPAQLCDPSNPTGRGCQQAQGGAAAPMALSKQDLQNLIDGKSSTITIGGQSIPINIS